MTDQELMVLAANGWVVECESPLEIRHDDNSFATMSAARIVIEALIDAAVPEPAISKENTSG